jgi:tRNA N6-adenosine threonylcarbamoyltransferase
VSVRILGIESSCDETAAAVVADGCEILSSVVSSQMDIHSKYGGVVPELASREHLRQIVPVVREALEKAGLKFSDLDAIGVTQGPGLVGALLVGVAYAKALAIELGKPLVAVNHLEGHVHAVLLEAHRAALTPQLPAVCLIVSGGHTLLYEVTLSGDHGDTQKPFSYRRLSGTRDDAAGEAYDKVARLLGLGYPGGPIIDQLAEGVEVAKSSDGGANNLRFGPTKMSGNALDFSFSGVKTAVLYHLREHPELNAEIEARREALLAGKRSAGQLRPMCSPHTLDLIASFQRKVVHELVSRSLAAATQCGVKTILVSGGVAANRELRQSFDVEARNQGVSAFFPSRELSTDNAAMIAAAAFARYSIGERAGSDLNAMPSMPLGAS